MVGSRRSFILGTVAALASAAVQPQTALAAEPILKVSTPMDPPEWALLEREVLRAHTAAEAFFLR